MSWAKGSPVGAMLKAEAAETASKSARATAEAKFKETYKKTPTAYISDFIVAAYAKSSKASGYAGRSEAGKYHSDNITPTDSPSPDVQAYHAMEDRGKKHAQKGELAEAIACYDNAADMRIAYESKRSMATDAGHGAAVATLQKRRASLSNLKIDLQDNDPDVVAARLLVKNFFIKHGSTWP